MIISPYLSILVWLQLSLMATDLHLFKWSWSSFKVTGDQKSQTAVSTILQFFHWSGWKFLYCWLELVWWTTYQFCITWILFKRDSPLVILSTGCVYDHHYIVQLFLVTRSHPQRQNVTASMAGLKIVTYVNISSEMVKLRNLAGNTEQEQEENHKDTGKPKSLCLLSGKVLEHLQFSLECYWDVIVWWIYTQFVAHDLYSRELKLTLEILSKTLNIGLDPDLYMPHFSKLTWW